MAPTSEILRESDLQLCKHIHNKWKYMCIRLEASMTNISGVTDVSMKEEIWLPIVLFATLT